MDSIVRNFNTDENFWETNPAFLTIELFDEFQKKDRSKKHSKSSKIMWAIAFLVDPHEHNVWRNLTEDDRRMLILEDFVKDDKFQWSDYQHLIDEYYKRALTLPEKDYVELIEKLHERKEFIKKTPYSLDDNTAKTIDSMLLSTSKIYEQLEQVREKLQRSKQVSGETKGGMEESATEQGLL